jgi:glutamine phosphoribosylpyrophosphate amidotransferase
MTLVLRVNRLLVVAKDINGLRPIVMGKVFL